MKLEHLIWFMLVLYTAMLFIADKDIYIVASFLVVIVSLKIMIWWWKREKNKVGGKTSS